MKRTILFSFFLCLFGLNVSTAQVSDAEMEEQAKELGMLQASIAKSDAQRSLNISLDRYEIALKNNDALEMKEVEGAIASQMDAILTLQSDPTIKSAQTSLLRKFQTINAKDKAQVSSVLNEIRAMK